MNDIVAMHRTCVGQVYQLDYYLNRFQEVCERVGLMWSHPETGDMVDTALYELTDAEKIVSFWNKFWGALPDSPAIHRRPFYLICDICEYDYRDE